MNEYYLPAQIVLLFLTFGIVFYKSFIQEKGKNLATKQDIEVITQKIES